jgi:ribosomal protein S18 acetylase RimI-like enzyme
MRQVTVQDIPVLRAVAIQSFRDLLEKSNSPENMKLYIDNNLSYAQLEKEFHEHGTVFFIFFDGDNAIAYLKLRIGYEPEELKGIRALEIERLYCIQEYVGRKVGSLLMQTALDYARQHTYELVWLGVWEDNPRAIAFYQKWGFEKFGSHTFMLGTDAQTDFLMKKNVTEA